MKDIESLLKEAEGTKSLVDKITEEAMPFFEGCVQRVTEGRQLKPYVIWRILKNEYGCDVAETSVRKDFVNIARSNGK